VDGLNRNIQSISDLIAREKSVDLALHDFDKIREALRGIEKGMWCTACVIFISQEYSGT
jgi:hypothetical protein